MTVHVNFALKQKYHVQCILAQDSAGLNPTGQADEFFYGTAVLKVHDHMSHLLQVRKQSTIRFCRWDYRHRG